LPRSGVVVPAEVGAIPTRAAAVTARSAST
jgi:hypothetical protein